ncbi:T9SS type A sorting domain-containing protein [Crocinitomix algicola]|uniref:T9SS type A sorting domain-containing protein n=1 Tax=Crocinitomix algicola TaxID=1740263 RepID=UPI00083438CE|nr:T9SS type A sorting domain-containing protein [Crocinitomix algicola]
MKILNQALLIFFCAPIYLSSQIISQFTWESDPVTNADIGPNGTSVSPSAISDINGAGGTNGLNPGLPKRDIELFIPGSPTFDVEGIDISFDFQRDESVAQFFERSPSLSINGSANLSVTYRVDDGAGGYTTVSSGSVYSIPNDNTFRTYRFYYLPDTGEGVIMVNGVEVWSNDGPDGRNLYWTGAGDVQVGNDMDGSGSNRTTLDNLTVARVIGSPLPIELIAFNAILSETATPIVTCSWITLSETENDYFILERSIDGKHWNQLAKIDGAGNSNEKIEYSYIDEKPMKGVSYYRLSQVDFDGSLNVKDIRSVNNDQSSFKLYPNPSYDFVQIELKENKGSTIVQIFNPLGQIVYQEEVSPTMTNLLTVNLSSFKAGVYSVLVDGEIQQLIVN